MKMTTMMNALKGIKPHIPLIRFRYGANELVRGTTEAEAAATPAVPAPAPAPPSVLEEWELPFRFRRQPISEEEIEYINRGGPA